MSDREIEQEIRRKVREIQRLQAEIHEARGYISGLRRRLAQAGERAAARAPKLGDLVVRVR